jgi:uracil-DNA glycosylase family 4
MKHPHKLCFKCPLQEVWAAGQFALPAKPTLESPRKLAIVGEAPGEQEAIQHRPFVGKSGELLDGLLESAGVNRDTVLVSNTLLCRPPDNRAPSLLETACCAPLLDFVLRKYRVERVLALGVPATTRLTGLGDPKITKIRGIWYRSNDGHRRHVLPSIHPAFVLRQPTRVLDLFSDIKKWAFEKITDPPTIEHTFLVDADHAQKLLGKLLEWAEHRDDPYVCLDLETSNRARRGRIILDPYLDRILQVGIGWSKTYSVVVDASLLPNPEIGELLKKLFHHPRLRWIGHNFEFDRKWLLAQFGDAPDTADDTMIMHYLLDERRGTQGLKSIVRDLWGHPDYEEYLVQWYLPRMTASFELVPPEKLATYAARDTCYTLRVAETLGPRLSAERLQGLYRKVLLPAGTLYSEMSLHGILVDRKHLRTVGGTFVEARRVAEQRLQEIADDSELNPRSPAQLARVIYDELGLPQPRGRRIKPRSTNKEALKKLQGRHEFIDVLLSHRKYQKLLSTYVIPIAEDCQYDGRYRASFGLTSTVTGRIAGGLLLTIPRAYTPEGKAIRDAFVATPGHVFVSVDYSQAEFRALASLSGDEFLVDAFNQGEDFHSKVAEAMYGPNYSKEDRMAAKMFNFSWIYGGSEYSFAEDAGLPISEARQWVRRYNALMPQATEWMRLQFARARREGFVLNAYNRRRRFFLTISRNANDVRKQSVNAPIQSVVSDMTIDAMIRAAPGLKALGVHLLLTFHDSVCFEVPPENLDDAIYVLAEHMQSVAVERLGESVKYPVDADVGERWGSLEGYASI